jgi:hypothetical protein
MDYTINSKKKSHTILFSKIPTLSLDLDHFELFSKKLTTKEYN